MICRRRDAALDLDADLPQGVAGVFEQHFIQQLAHHVVSPETDQHQAADTERDPAADPAELLALMGLAGGGKEDVLRGVPTAIAGAFHGFSLGIERDKAMMRSQSASKV